MELKKVILEVLVLLGFLLVVVSSLWGLLYCRKHASGLADQCRSEKVVLKMSPVAGGAVILIMIGIWLGGILKWFPGGTRESSSVFIIFSFSAIVGVFAVSRVNPAQLWGLWGEKISRYLKWAVIVYLAVLIPMGLISFVYGLILQWGGVDIHAQDAIKIFMRLKDPGKMAMFYFDACILAPVLEEMIFRGFVFPLLRGMTGERVAIGVSAVMFSAAHYHLSSFLPLMFLGVILAKVYHVSGRIGYAVFLHAVFNAMTLGVLTLVKAMGCGQSLVGAF